ncbi:hypothetical protein [Kitasatospora azatica]|uniref:hypothetical protein n=1 Tax=Kitasatospora azatica TaxID=58347 RepID=UPI00056CCAF6|nr:hypothetical protein [Kitasatospora azatica]
MDYIHYLAIHEFYLEYKLKRMLPSDPRRLSVILALTSTQAKLKTLRETEEERQQLRRLLDKHENWVVDELEWRREARQEHVGRESSETKRHAVMQTPSGAPRPPQSVVVMQQHHTTHPLQRQIEQFQEDVRRVNHPSYRLPEEGW